MPDPVIHIASSGPSITDWITSLGSVLAAGAAAFAIWVARVDIKKVNRQAKARLTYDIHKDVLSYVNSLPASSPPQAKLLFYYSMFNLIEAGLLHEGLKTLVDQDLASLKQNPEFQKFWNDQKNRENYPMDFQDFISKRI